VEFSAAGLIRDRKESRSRPRPGFSLIVLWDRRHRLPSVVDQPKNLAVIAKLVKIAGISGACHGILPLGPRVEREAGPARSATGQLPRYCGASGGTCSSRCFCIATASFSWAVEVPVPSGRSPGVANPSPQSSPLKACRCAITSPTSSLR
jgi:hypothetical protein